MKYLMLVPAFGLLLSACAVTPKSFYENPSKATDTALCRAIMETTDQTFQRDAAIEAVRRGLTAEKCQNAVNMQNAAILGIAAVATGAAVIAACSNGCAAPSYRPAAYSAADYDCAGGGGDGPYYVQGPFRLTGPDIYGLDRDGDGIACEPYDDH